MPRAKEPHELPPYSCRRHGPIEPIVQRTGSGYLHRRCPTCLAHFDKTKWQRLYRAGQAPGRVYRRVTRSDAYECKKCGSHDFFASELPDGRIRRICAPCDRSRNRSSALRSQRKWRAAAMREYGGRCFCCGEANILFLTIDHIENDGSSERRQNSRARAGIYHWLKVAGYPKDRYRLACFNCNMGRARNGGICPHAGGLVG